MRRPSDPVSVLEQYEALRRDVLAGKHGGHGLALLLARGMVAWIDALVVLAPPVSVGLPSKARFSFAAELATSTRSELTHVLADMVLACSEERGR